MVRKVLLAVILVGLLVWLLGCQTFAGAGRDVTGASEAVEGWITK